MDATSRLVTTPTGAALERSLTNQAPRDDTIIARFEAIRASARELGASILEQTPQSREQSQAITKLEECVMWAVKAVAVHQDQL